MFEIHKSAQGYWWRLKGRNGEVLCHSEVYTAKQSALDTIATVRQIAPTAPIRDLS
ncbi:YegP family protein [Paracoccus contaminans]|uniref:DUF1508 domain-containing protein n=1 Tax=Paracoccus contaminans TaxID=1945662 RepID=A0A1W6CY02_9RHOB|nr:YegP family protein [Paracoccus contaminans]ARJ69743.1 hypothetical protein B0A89_09010 [Paracoccus contaminans]